MTNINIMVKKYKKPTTRNPKLKIILLMSLFYFINNSVISLAYINKEKIRQIDIQDDRHRDRQIDNDIQKDKQSLDAQKDI